MWIHVSVLPAHPTVSFPSSSLSRLTRTVPVTNFGSSPFAPSRPTSSATVMRSSRGPWRFDSSSTSAIIAAIATPSSAPSVVPFAVSQSPSRASSIRPSAGSFGLSGSRSQTMSRWPLQGDFRRRLPALAGRNPHDEVAGRVAFDLEVVLLGPGADMVAHRLLLARGTRDPRQRIEMAPERLRLEPGQHGRLHCGHVLLLPSRATIPRGDSPEQ